MFQLPSLIPSHANKAEVNLNNLKPLLRTSSLLPNPSTNKGEVTLRCMCFDAHALCMCCLLKMNLGIIVQ